MKKILFSLLLWALIPIALLGQGLEGTTIDYSAVVISDIDSLGGLPASAYLQKADSNLYVTVTAQDDTLANYVLLSDSNSVYLTPLDLINGLIPYFDSLEVKAWVNSQSYLIGTDTLSLSNRIDLKLTATDTLSLSNRIDNKLDISDTTSLSGRVDLNTTHKSSAGTDHSDVGLNNTHRTSDGSDHTFIDQSVTSGSSPTFVGTNITGVDADTTSGDIAASQVDDLQDTVSANDSVVLNTTHRASDGSSHTFIDQSVTSASSPTFVYIIVDSANVDTLIVVSQIRLSGVQIDSAISATQFTGNLGNSTTGGDTLWFSVLDAQRLYITDAGGNDSTLIYDDGDTTRFESDNPIKIGTGSIIVEVDADLITGTTGNVKNYITKKIFNDSTVTGDVALTSALPAGYAIDYILFKNTTASSITQFDIGFTSGGGEIVANGNISGNDEGSFTILQRIDDFDAADNIFLEATAWNGTTLIIYIIMSKTF